MQSLCRPRFFKQIILFLISTILAFTCIILLCQQIALTDRTPKSIYFRSNHIGSPKEESPELSSILSHVQSLSSSLLKENSPDIESFSTSYHAAVDKEYELFLQRPIVNHHNFEYILNQQETCKETPVHIIITTPSAPGNFFRRMKAREVVPTNSVVRHLFFIGRTLNNDVQAKIEAEAKTFRDIVQEDFLDVYKNITHKAIGMLKWVAEFCPKSKYTLRLDDDVTADLVKMSSAMRSAHMEHPHFVIGNVKVGWGPCQIPKCKTTKEEYSGSTLPPFALGGALGYPTESVIRLFEATKRVRWFKLDDVFVTGMCAPLVNVTLLRHQDFIFKHGAW